MQEEGQHSSDMLLIKDVLLIKPRFDRGMISARSVYIHCSMGYCWAALH